MNATADNWDARPPRGLAALLSNADNRLMLAILAALAVVGVALGAWIYAESHGPQAELRLQLVDDRHHLALIYKAMRAQLAPPAGPSTPPATQPAMLFTTMDQFLTTRPAPPPMVHANPAPGVHEVTVTKSIGVELKPEYFKSATNPDRSAPRLIVNSDPRTGHRFGDYWFVYAGLEPQIASGKGDAGKAIIVISAAAPAVGRNRNLVYADGSVISVSTAELADLLAQQNKLRKEKWGLPPLDVAAIVEGRGQESSP